MAAKTQELYMKVVLLIDHLGAGGAQRQLAGLACMLKERGVDVSVFTYYPIMFYEEILQHAIMAGADLLCLSNNGQEYDKDLVPKTIDLIYEMVKTGKIKRSRIHESCSRINKLKSTISH